MLDVIEASTGHSLTTPRQIAIAAVATVDRTDSRVAATIAERGSRWQSYISLEIRGDRSDRGEDSFHAQRCRRLKERIGTAESGPVTIADREFEIVERTDDDLIVAAAQLLQGPPTRVRHRVLRSRRNSLCCCWRRRSTGAPVLAQHSQLRRPSTDRRHAAIRVANDTITYPPSRPSSRPQRSDRLLAAVANRLLRRCRGGPWRTDPKIDHYHQYETDYIPDPSRSFFRLERRHAAMVLCDKTLAMFGRIDRAKDALLDPSFDVPQAFVDELASTSESFDFSRTATGPWSDVRRSPVGTPVSRSCTMRSKPPRRLRTHAPAAIRGPLR